MILDEALLCTLCGVTIALLLLFLHHLTSTRHTNPPDVKPHRITGNSELVSDSGSPWHTSKQGTPQFFTQPLPYSHPSPDHFQPPPSCGLPSPDSRAVRERKLLQSLCREACSKAKDAGRHPSYVPLCLTLVHHYNLDVNSPVLSNGLSIFLCSCLSGSQELLSSLLPLADLAQTTDHGETALYLAVYAAAHLSVAEQVGGEVAVIRMLLEAGVGVDLPNLAGVTALQVASMKGSLVLYRLLLDCGASPQGIFNNTFIRPIRGQENRFDYSMASSNRDTSMVTRARARGSALNSSMCATGSDLNSTLNTQTRALNSTMISSSRALNSTMGSQIRGHGPGQQTGHGMKQDSSARLRR